MNENALDISTYFSENLHDVANNEVEMRQFLTELKEQLQQSEIDTPERVRLLGLIGSYARILRDLADAEKVLLDAVKLSEHIQDEPLKTANQIRLAHVFQWQKRFQASESLFDQVIERCQRNPDLTNYLDFAYQHAGKCKFDQQQYECARTYFEQALRLRLQKDHQPLINSTRLALTAVDRRLSAQPPHDD